MGKSNRLLVLFIIFLSVNLFFASGEDIQLILQTVSDRVISPAGTRSARPEILLIGDRFYIIYLQISPVRTFRIIVMDRDLTSQGMANIFSGNYQPTDIRICSGEANYFYTAFENTGKNDGISNTLSISRYKTTESLPLPVNSNIDFAEAPPVIIPSRLPPKDTDLLDDPAPFFYKGNFYTITRKWESAILKIHKFSPELQHIETYLLDIGKVLPGLYLSVNSFVNIEGKPYLITGVSNEPPVSETSSSWIVAIPLDETLKKVSGSPVTLSKTNKYETYVACARYYNEILFAGYDIIEKPLDVKQLPEHSRLKNLPVFHYGVIKAFDVRNGFKELGSIQVNSGNMIDNHFTFEVSLGKLYVAYQSPDEKLHIKVIAFIFTDQVPCKCKASNPLYLQYPP
ncbi:MAG TPA: hypothetical protein PLQ41_03955 [bacterium]|nr:hypothetical protein [bacterium]HPP30258.1 hypothetical protein [bacterium]